jgi:uncharacterized protein (DUF2141 family)
MKSHFKYILLLWSICFSVCAQTLDVHISNIRNGKGVLRVAVFANQIGFSAEKELFAIKYSKANIQNGEMRVQIPISKGNYGISVLDDENENGKMEYKFKCFPTEGFGFSDYYHKGIKKPVFDDFDFVVEQDEIKIIKVKMRYF